MEKINPAAAMSHDGAPSVMQPLLSRWSRGEQRPSAGIVRLNHSRSAVKLLVCGVGLVPSRNQLINRLGVIDHSRRQSF